MRMKGTVDEGCRMVKDEHSAAEFISTSMMGPIQQ
jgi:hypothetical protein